MITRLINRTIIGEEPVAKLTQVRLNSSRQSSPVSAQVLGHARTSRQISQSTFYLGQEPKVESAWKAKSEPILCQLLCAIRPTTEHCHTRCLSASIFVFQLKIINCTIPPENALDFLPLLMSLDFVPRRWLRNISVVVTSQRAQV